MNDDLHNDALEEDDELLLMELGRLAGVQKAEEPAEAWDDVARGQSAPEHDEVLAEIFRPLDHERIDRIDAQIEQNAIERETVSPLAEARAAKAHRDGTSRLEPGNKKRRWWPPILGVVAAAALVLRAVQSGMAANEVTSLPADELSLNAGAQALRGLDDAWEDEPSFGESTLYELVVRPQAATQGAPRIYSVIVDSLGAHMVSLPWQRTDEGVFRLRGAAGELFDARGRLELVIVVGGNGLESLGPEQLMDLSSTEEHRVLRRAFAIGTTQ